MFFAVIVVVPAAPADQPEPNPAAQQAPNPAAPPIAPTPPAESVRSVAENRDDENTLRRMKSRNHRRIGPDIAAPIDFEHVDCKGKKRCISRKNKDDQRKKSSKQPAESKTIYATISGIVFLYKVHS